MELQLVVFDLAHELCGVEIDAVDGILKPPAITAGPHVPTFGEGVTHLRGAAVPVIDLRQRFGLPPRTVTSASRILVVLIGQLKVGMVVDAVTEVLRIPEEAIQPPSPLVTLVDTAFIKGIAKVPDGADHRQRLIILLDLSSIYTATDLAPIA